MAEQFGEEPVPEYSEPETVEEKIIWYSIRYEVDQDLALSIARAESSFNPNAQNSHSTASGVYQFINGTFKGFCIDKFNLTDSMDNKLDPDVQIECAIRMISEGGAGHWNASKHVWGGV